MYVDRKPMPEARRTVLVAEDEASIRRLIQACLDANSYSVAETSAGDQAIRLLSDRPFDLLVLDLGLEGVDGWEVLRALEGKAGPKRPRVIVLTARTAEDDILRAWRLGADGYCMKPFEPAEFVKLVESVLSSSEEELARNRKMELERTELLHLLDNTFGTR